MDKRKEIEFALNDYVCECCRIIWCLLSKDEEDYILYPTQFGEVYKKRSKFKIIDMEFVDKYGDFEDFKENDRMIVECARTKAISKMNAYDEKFHKREIGSLDNGKEIEYCSWPSIVKLRSNKHELSSHLFERLSDADLHADEDNFEFLTRAVVFCL